MSQSGPLKCFCLQSPSIADSPINDSNKAGIPTGQAGQQPQRGMRGAVFYTARRATPCGAASLSSLVQRDAANDTPIEGTNKGRLIAWRILLS